tara:strand:- start:1374 stop:2210 length:837 start_codon:yes stop_codon:yes gene_type:complete
VTTVGSREKIKIINKNKLLTKVIVCGILHPNNIDYFSSFIENLNNQTYPSFDLLIINEGIDNLKLNFIKGQLFIEDSVTLDPKKNRDQMFESLRKLKYDVNILTDLDDLMSNDRVNESVISITKNKSDICYNDIVPFVDEKQISINDRFWSEREDFKNQKPNIKHNVFGLGNTAISSRISSLDIKVSDNPVYDWEYFLKVYSLSKYIISKSNGYTFYRQINNTLGISELAKKKIDQIRIIKIFTLNQVTDKYTSAKEEILKIKNKNYKKINKPYWFEL